MSEYKQIIDEMHKDMNRTQRQREVEACFSEPLPRILENVYQSEGTKAGAVRRLSNALDANGFDDSLSKPTLYSWMKHYGIGEYGDDEE